jgi:hypothetical protein
MPAAAYSHKRRNRNVAGLTLNSCRAQSARGMDGKSNATQGKVKAMATRYEFEFISQYDGRANYRVYRNGKDDGRIVLHQRKRTLTYSDDSRVLCSTLAAFNAWKADEFARAQVEFPDMYGTETFQPYI